MLPIDGDTIVAIATPPGVGGVGIIRISGNLASSIAMKVVKKPCVVPNKAIYTDFLSHHAETLDSGIAIFFKGPYSFTGEDVIEIQAHGGPVILSMLLRTIVEMGARIAEPGEFSRRAFLSQKIDLIQAESVVSLINAQTEQAALAAVKSLQGEFSKQINLLLEELIAIRMHLEAIIDFPEDDIDVLSWTLIESNMINLQTKISVTLQCAKNGSLINHGIKAVILGKPNVGKSSLLNFLLGEDRVIVTDIPGTTRDVVSHVVNIDGLLINFADTAGVRLTSDVVEKLGIAKAIKEIEVADLIILMITAEEFLAARDFSIINFLPETISLDLLSNKKILLLINKIDLHVMPSTMFEKNNLTAIFVSIKNNIGIDLLKQQIKQTIGFSCENLVFTAKERHVESLKQVYDHVVCGKQIFSDNKQGWDLVAEELRLGQECLSKITGVFTNEDLLSKIFSEFCIGK